MLRDSSFCIFHNYEQDKNPPLKEKDSVIGSEGEIQLHALLTSDASETEAQKVKATG